MQKITPATHAQLRWQKFTTYEFARQTAMAPLVAAEMGQAVRTLPLAFIPHQDGYTLQAVLSREPDTNLYVAPNGQWLGGYVPAAFRGYPFTLQDGELYVEEAMLGRAGEPFYADNGELAQPVRDILNFLRQIEANRKITNQAVSALAAAGAITLWEDNLYRTDEAALLKLPGPDFLKLRQTGSLSVAYAQLFSLANFKIFAKLKQMSAHLAQPKPRQQPTMPKINLDEGDIIKFS